MSDPVAAPASIDVPVDAALHDRLRAVADELATDVPALVAAAARAHLEIVAGGDGAPAGREFRKIGSDRQAQVLIRQDTDVGFTQLEPFRYDGGPGACWTVPAGSATDLASVPGWMTWLVPRYGRHTLPALLHDHLQDAVPAVSSWTADGVFRDSMRATGVPFVRRWVMWAAVAMRTLVKKEQVGWPWVIVILAWVALYGIGAGIVGWVWMLAEVADHRMDLAVTEVVLIALAGVLVLLGDIRTPGLATVGRVLSPGVGLLAILGAVAIPVLLAVQGETWVPLAHLGLLVSPVLLGGLWGRRAYRVGLIGGVALALLAFPIVFVVWAVLVYRAAEGLVGRFPQVEKSFTTVRDFRDGELEVAPPKADPAAAAPAASPDPG